MKTTNNNENSFSFRFPRRQSKALAAQKKIAGVLNELKELNIITSSPQPLVSGSKNSKNLHASLTEALDNTTKPTSNTIDSWISIKNNLSSINTEDLKSKNPFKQLKHQDNRKILVSNLELFKKKVDSDIDTYFKKEIKTKMNDHLSNLTPSDKNTLIEEITSLLQNENEPPILSRESKEKVLSHFKDITTLFLYFKEIQSISPENQVLNKVDLTTFQRFNESLKDFLYQKLIDETDKNKISERSNLKQTQKAIMTCEDIIKTIEAKQEITEFMKNNLNKKDEEIQEIMNIPDFLNSYISLIDKLTPNYGDLQNEKDVEQVKTFLGLAGDKTQNMQMDRDKLKDKIAIINNGLLKQGERLKDSDNSRKKRVNFFNIISDIEKGLRIRPIYTLKPPIYDINIVDDIGEIKVIKKEDIVISAEGETNIENKVMVNNQKDKDELVSFINKKNENGYVTTLVKTKEKDTLIFTDRSIQHDDYDLGQGGFKVTRIGFLIKPDGNMSKYAINETLNSNWQDLSGIFKETQILKDVPDHKNIGFPKMVFQYLSDSKNKNSVQFAFLTKLYDKLPKLTVDNQKKIMKQSAEGLHHLHKNGIVHGDFGPGNLLYDKDENEGEVKIIDFGASSDIKNNVINSIYGGHTRDESQPTRPTLSDAIEDKLDSYHFAVTFLQKMGVDQKDINSTLKRLKESENQEENKLADLFENCICKASERFTMRQILDHEYFK